MRCAQATPTPLRIYLQIRDAPIHSDESRLGMSIK